MRASAGTLRGTRVSIRLILCVAVVALAVPGAFVVLLSTASPASASVSTQSIAGTTNLVGVACSVSTTCSAVGDTSHSPNGVVVSITNDTVGFVSDGDGWYTAASGSAEVGDAGSSDTFPSGGATLYAQLAALCSPGYYSTTGSAPCTAAPPGTYVSTSGATSPTSCELGTYQPSAGQSSCSPGRPRQLRGRHRGGFGVGLCGRHVPAGRRTVFVSPGRPRKLRGHHRGDLRSRPVRSARTSRPPESPRVSRPTPAATWPPPGRLRSRPARSAPTSRPPDSLVSPGRPGSYVATTGGCGVGLCDRHVPAGRRTVFVSPGRPRQLRGHHRGNLGVSVLSRCL